MENQTERAVQKQEAAHVPATQTPNRAYDDGMTQEDFEIPRAKIVQFTSEEAQATDQADRLNPGTFINSVSKKEIPLVFIPILRYKTYMRWNPKKSNDPNFDPAYEPSALIFSTTDRHDPRIGKGLEFGPAGQTPAVTQVINFLCSFEGQKLPMVLSFQKTSFRGGKRLNTLLEEAGGALYSNKFKLVFTIQENAGSKYYVMDVRANGKATPEEFAICEAFYNRFKAVDIEKKAHQESEQFTD